jgi:hypothetical protein
MTASRTGADQSSPEITEPLALAAADFDEDGMQDLLSAHATTQGGLLVLRRSNADPVSKGKADSIRATASQFSIISAFNLPNRLDFIGAGDFDADGHLDVVAATRGSDALYFLRGDGQGGFDVPQRVQMPGAITAMATGEINQRDGLTDLLVGIIGADGARVFVFESPEGALKAPAESFALPAPATSIVLRHAVSDVMDDAVIAAGHDLVIIKGRDRKLSFQRMEGDEVEAPLVTRQSFPFTLQSLAIGSFVSAQPESDIAVLGGDGRVHFLQRADIDQSSPEAASPAIQQKATDTVQVARQEIPVVDGDGEVHTVERTIIDPGSSLSAATAQKRTASVKSSLRWREHKTVSPAALSSRRGLLPVLISTRVSALPNPYDDLIIADSATRQFRSGKIRSKRWRALQRVMSDPRLRCRHLKLTARR